MLNFLSVVSVAGVFVTAINVMCAFTPGTLIQVLALTGNM